MRCTPEITPSINNFVNSNLKLHVFVISSSLQKYSISFKTQHIWDEFLFYCISRLIRLRIAVFGAEFIYISFDVWVFDWVKWRDRSRSYIQVAKDPCFHQWQNLILRWSKKCMWRMRLRFLLCRPEILHPSIYNDYEKLI